VAPVAAFVAILLCPFVAGLAWGQEPDIFEEAGSFFGTTTIEGASKHAESPMETPATVTVLSRDDIERYGFRTVADVLNFASIGMSSYNDRRYDFIGSRGMFLLEDYNSRILVLLNGHPLNEPWSNTGDYGREMLVPLDLAERVEIVYGPSSLLYGGYGVYGIINVVTGTGASLPGGRLSISGGSWESAEVLGSWGATGNLGERSEGAAWEILASGGYYRTRGENLDLPRREVDFPVDFQGGTTWGGRQDGTDFERAPFGLLLGKVGELSFLARSGYRTHGAPMAPYETVYGSTREFVRDDKSFAELRWDHPLTSRLSLSTRLFRDWYKYEENDPYADSESYPGRSGYDFVLEGDNVDTGGEARLTWRGDTSIVTAGAEYRRRTIHQRSFNRLAGSGIDEESFLAGTVRGRLSVVYLQEEWRPADAWTFVVGGTWAETSPGGSKAQPRLAIIWKPVEKLSIKGIYGTGFRAPSVYEAGYGDWVYEIPNPKLSPESMSSTELSIIWAVSPGFTAEGYAFRSRLDDLIDQVEIEDPSDVDGGVVSQSGNPEDLIGMLQYQSVGRLDSKGAGLAFRGRSGPLRGYLNVAWAEGELRAEDGGTTELPAVSDWLATGGISADLGAATASLSARYVGPALLDPGYATEGETDSFFEANLRLLWKTVFTYPMTFWLDAGNLFDSDGSVASAAVVHVPETIPIEGRHLGAGMSIRF
jgi:iron complex outermembrane receptor protein